MSKDILYPLRRLHGRMHEWKRYAWPIIKKRLQNPKAVFLILTPEHDNMGDQALAYAEGKMLQRLGIEYIELTGKMLQPLYAYGWLNVMNGRTILFNGGGYLGTIWFSSEKMVRKVLQQNPRSTICMLPNTLYYEDTPEGNAEKELSVQLYGKHRKLHLYAREKVSYNAMRSLYRNVKLIPDMVLSLDESGGQTQRSGCLLCLRGDREKTRTEEADRIIYEQAKSLFGDAVVYTDMHAGHEIPPENREQELQKKYAQFKGAQLVITDRLHGMIFCAITGTPCIVVDSKSPKVKGCYAWLEHLKYIRFAEDLSQIAQIYSDMQKTDCHYDNTHLQRYYEELEEDILRFARSKAEK